MHLLVDEAKEVLTAQTVVVAVVPVLLEIMHKRDQAGLLLLILEQTVELD